MARLFSFAAWNVENFRNEQSRISRCVSFIKGLTSSNNGPDVFGVFEVRAKEVFEAFVEQMSDHHFFITEGIQTQDTLIGVRKNRTSFVSQRERFKSKIPTLRPGTLVTLSVADEYYPILFVHIKSLRDPVGWGLRDDMMGHVINLKKALDRQTDDPAGANFIALGDFNTMGMNVTFSNKDFTGPEELQRFDDRVQSRNMRLVPKTHNQTWWNGGSIPPSNLDHVFAANHLNIRSGGQQLISVKGWVEFSAESQKLDWIQRFSDHSLLYGEVHS